jgi:hypothetical protein
VKVNAGSRVLNPCIYPNSTLLTNPNTHLLDVTQCVVELIFKLGSRILNGSGLGLVLDFFSCVVLRKQKPSDQQILLSGRPKKSISFAVCN